jgi:AraC-like DNA-binding protein
MSLITNLYFSLTVFSIIVLADLLIKFKRPLLLKLYFVALVLSVGLLSIFYSSDSVLVLLFQMSLKSLISITLLYIFFSLYIANLKWLIHVYSVFIISFILLLFYHIIHINGYNVFNLSFDEIGKLNFKGFKFPVYIFICRMLLHVSFFGIMLYVWYFINYRIKQKNIYFDKIKIWSSVTIAIVILSLILNTYVPIYKEKTILAHIISLFINYNLLLLVFYRPGFLNRSALKIAFGEKFNQESTYDISTDDFIKEFFTNLYFTDSEASLENLAKKMGINSNDLYRFVYNNYSMSFNDLVNKNRVAYFLDIVHNEQYKNYTIDALAKVVGFSSRQHLYKPFKKFHGGNPSDIIDAIN